MPKNKRVTNRWALPAALICLAGLAAARAGAAPAAGWVNVTSNVGGETWGAYGVTYVQAVPDSHEVIAGVSERGLWATGDGGKTWRKLGGNEIKFRPGRIVFDPKNTSVFWVSGCYGDAPFKTEDGGKTFRRLGKLAHADGVAIDFTDPGRKTLLLGLHEQSQSLQLSSNGGSTWTKIGANLPTETGITQVFLDPVGRVLEPLLDAAEDAFLFLLRLVGFLCGLYLFRAGGALLLAGRE